MLAMTSPGFRWKYARFSAESRTTHVALFDRLSMRFKAKSEVINGTSCTMGALAI